MNLGATEYKRYPKDEKPTKDNTTIGSNLIKHAFVNDEINHHNNDRNHQKINPSQCGTVSQTHADLLLIDVFHHHIVIVGKRINDREDKI